MTPRLGRKLGNEQCDYERAKHGHEDDEGAPRAWRRIGIGIVKKGKTPQEKQIVNEPDEPAKCDRSKSGDDADEDCNE